MKKIRIAQIGTSYNSHGIAIFDTLKKHSDIFEVAGYNLPENEREKFPERMSCFEGCREMSLEEILENPEIDAVTVETEEIYLTKYARMAAEHKKHIHMEKPGSVDYAEFEKLIRTVEKNKTVFHIGYMYRYNPEIARLINSVKAGELGEILSVEAQMNCFHPKNVREWLSTFPGGMMFFLGCHLIDLILQIKGTPDKVIALNKSSGLDDIKSEDSGFSIFEYDNGVSFAKTTAVERGGFTRRQLVVTGTRKTVEIKPLESFGEKGKIYASKTEYATDEWCDKGTKSTSELFDRYSSMLLAFAEMVRGDIVNPYTYEYELELYKTVLKACGVPCK